MTYLNRDLIRECLRELSDKDFQERVWTASSGPEISSFTEAVVQLFNDSGLGLALEKGVVAFGSPIDDVLKTLRALLKEIPHNRPPLDVINDKKMVDVRDLSLRILQYLPKQGASGEA